MERFSGKPEIPAPPCSGQPVRRGNFRKTQVHARLQRSAEGRHGGAAPEPGLPAGAPQTKERHPANVTKRGSRDEPEVRASAGRLPSLPFRSHFRSACPFSAALGVRGGSWHVPLGVGGVEFTELQMSSEDKEAQEDELFALASIYDEEVFERAPSVRGGEIRISVDLPEDFTLFLSGNETENLQNNKFECTVSFLPPIVLNFEYPGDYPSTSPPVFTLSSKWLSWAQLTTLCRHLDNLWEENRGSVVLFAWIQFLKEETLTCLNITSPYEPKICGRKKEQSGTEKEEACCSAVGGATAREESLDTRAVQDVESLSSLTREILDFDQAQQQKCFNSKMHDCNICFSEKLGSECMYFLDCKHVYCKACLKDYFEIQIRDGQVHRLNCPEPECQSVATPGQVKELVEEQLFARYDRLLLQSSLDLMADVVYCPRPRCETPVMQEPCHTMGICSSCNYAFCTLCKMTYHGVSPCKISSEKLIELRDEYLAADETAKRFLEQRYGKRVIQKALEEMESKEWLENNSKSCPSCETPIEKLDGCNKMTCTVCNKHFCWCCMGSLSRTNPYEHFNDPSSPCFNRLFEGLLNEEED